MLRADLPKVYLRCAFASFILLLSDVFSMGAPGVRGYIFSLLFNFLFYASSVSIVELAIAFCGQWNKRLSAVLEFLFHAAIFAYSCSSIFLILTFDLRWNSLTFQILRETNGGEVGGFINAYILTWRCVSLFLIFLVFALADWKAIPALSHRLPARLFGVVPNVIFGSVAVAFLTEWRFFSADFDANYFRSDKFIQRTSLWKLNQSWLQYNDFLADFERCADSQSDLRIDSVSFRSPNIVVVIGESFIRRHSSLYGYGLPTNPQLADEPDLTVFSDVVSPVNATTMSFQYFMSMAQTDDTLKWADTPFFPAFFKSVGYNVIFYSNQYVQEGDVNFFDASAGFFNQPRVQNQLFDVRNHHRYAFDDEMIDDYEKNRSELEADGNNLVIFHLVGQHSPAVERYPSYETFFAPEDIDRSDLDEAERSQIAQYDNAVRYNDKVVAHIIDLFRDRDCILLYFADHGEEMYDCRRSAGRKFDFDTNPDVARCQLEVPFLIWTSAEYGQNHPDVVERIKCARNHPAMLDALPHLLLYLGGIHSQWYKPENNLLDASYNIGRKRYITGGRDYDVITK